MRGRPIRVTNRPAVWADTALPTANAVTPSAEWRALKPSPRWKYSASTSGRPAIAGK